MPIAELAPSQPQSMCRCTRRVQAVGQLPGGFRVQPVVAMSVGPPTILADRPRGCAAAIAATSAVCRFSHRAWSGTRYSFRHTPMSPCAVGMATADAACRDGLESNSCVATLLPTVSIDGVLAGGRRHPPQRRPPASRRLPAHRALHTFEGC